MILVFYFLLVVIIISTIILCLICISKIEINIKDLYINTKNKELNNKEVLISIAIAVGKLKLIKFKINKNKIEEIYEIAKKEEEKNKEIQRKINKILKEVVLDKEKRKLLKKLKINIDKFDLNILIGIEDVIYTSYLVAIISIIIANILPHVTNKISEDVKYEIKPIYNKKNIFSLNLNSIFYIKLKNIIYVVWNLKELIVLEIKDYKKLKEKQKGKKVNNEIKENRKQIV